MSKLGYSTVGFAGAWLALNLGIALFQVDQKIDMVPLNLMSEALLLLVLGGIALDIYHFFSKPTTKKKGWASLLPSGVWLPVIVYLIGFVWELGTYGAMGWWLPFATPTLAERGSYIIGSWAVYGLVSIVFIGFPVLYCIDYLRKKKKVFGRELNGTTGLWVTFCSTAMISITMLYLMLEFKVIALISSLMVVP